MKRSGTCLSLSSGASLCVSSRLLRGHLCSGLLSTLSLRRSLLCHQGLRCGLLLRLSSGSLRYRLSSRFLCLGYSCCRLLGLCCSSHLLGLGSGRLPGLSCNLLGGYSRTLSLPRLRSLHGLC